MKPTNETIADALGHLRLVVHVSNGDHGGREHYLRFICMSCGQFHGRGAPIVVYEQEAGTFPLIRCRGLQSGEELFVVLPFDVFKFREHFLHDVRAEWDKIYVVSRPLSVQEWTRQEQGTLTIKRYR